MMRAAVRLIDTLLRKEGGLFEFSQDPEVILRLQLRTAPHRAMITGVSIDRGDPVLALHIWNERVPRIPPAGADLQWARALSRRIIYSLRAVAHWMEADSSCARVCAIFGASALFSSSDHTGGTHMIQRLGFTIWPYQRPLGRFGVFWENLFSWWLMWTYNEASLRTHAFWRLQRTEIWMVREDFLRRFG
jgi:hypothetical protein